MGWGYGVRCDRSNSLGGTRNSVVTAVTSYLPFWCYCIPLSQTRVPCHSFRTNIRRPKKSAHFGPAKKSKACCREVWYCFNPHEHMVWSGRHWSDFDPRWRWKVGSHLIQRATKPLTECWEGREWGNYSESRQNFFYPNLNKSALKGTWQCPPKNSAANSV